MLMSLTLSVGISLTGSFAVYKVNECIVFSCFALFVFHDTSVPEIKALSLKEHSMNLNEFSYIFKSQAEFEITLMTSLCHEDI